MAEKYARCGGCPVEFLTMGNLAGHCSGCHRTFRGERAFERHQTVDDGKVTCHDPATIYGHAGPRQGKPSYTNRVIDGVTYWTLWSDEGAAERFAAVRATRGHGE